MLEAVSWVEVPPSAQALCGGGAYHGIASLAGDAQEQFQFSYGAVYEMPLPP